MNHPAQPGIPEHDLAECELLHTFAGQTFEPTFVETRDLDLSAYDTVVVVFVRGEGRRLQQLVWPMKLGT